MLKFRTHIAGLTALPISDIFNISEIKKENEKLKKDNEHMKSFLNRAVEIKTENDRLKSFFEEIGGMDYIQVKEKTDSLKVDLANIQSNQKKWIEEIKQANSELDGKRKQMLSLDEDLMLESFALYKPHFSFQTSEEYKQRLEKIRDQQKAIIKNDSAAIAYKEWTINNNKAEGRKFVKDMKKLLLRSFNNECDSCVENVKFNNIALQEKRINTSFDTLNKLGSIANISLSENYKKLKFDELYLAFEYQQKKQDEKEERALIREELREQQKLEREIEIAREKIAKERKHFSQAIEEITNRISVSSNENEIKELNSKLSELKGQYNALDEEEKIVDYREKNAKAGYIYVISNLGAFGKNVFKIGMTRRLEPMDRVYELGDASVPFPFDTHAMIFSDNAPELEAKIHQHFHKSRLNKINSRREFFVADIDELEKVIKENYDKVVDFVKDPAAEQYRESLRVKN